MSNRNMQPRFQSIEMEPMDDSSDNSNQTWMPDGFNSLQLRRSEMHELIMDYLLHEGFKEAAERFREEAGIEPSKLGLSSNLPDSMMTDAPPAMMGDTNTNRNQKSHQSNNNNNNGSGSSSINNNNNADGTTTTTNDGNNLIHSINLVANNPNVAPLANVSQRLGSTTASNSTTINGSYVRLFNNGLANTTTTTANDHTDRNYSNQTKGDDWHYSSLVGKAETPEMMDKRIEIRRYIEEGDILRGQSLINLHYPELLDNHRDIYFKLQQQHLIELIRQQKIDDVLSYVHDQLSVDELGDLTEMERTLALLAYEQPDKSPYAKLLQSSHRLQLASEINDIILQETLGSIEPTKPRLVTLLKLLVWTQGELERKKIQFPKMTDLFNGTILEPRN